jgi:hypothetical protein
MKTGRRPFVEFKYVVAGFTPRLMRGSKRGLKPAASSIMFPDKRRHSLVGSPLRRYSALIRYSQYSETTIRGDPHSTKVHCVTAGVLEHSAVGPIRQVSLANC